MISNKYTNNGENNEERISYLSEILPDYQKRTRATIRDLEVAEEGIVTNENEDNRKEKSQISKYFEEFAGNSSIHGFNHLVARHRHPLERFLAGVFILASFASFIYVSVVSWHRYQYDGFIMLVDKQQDLIRLVKPSLLICPTRVIDESKFPETFERYNVTDTPKNRQFFYYLTNKSYTNMTSPPDYQPAPPELWLSIINDLKKEFYYKTSLPGKAIWVSLEIGICLSIGNHIHSYANIEYILANNRTLTSIPTFPPDVSDYQMEKREIDDPNYVPSYVYYQNQNITEFLTLDTEAWVEIIDPMELYKMKGPRHLIEISGESYTTVEVELLITTQELAHVLNNKYRRKCRFPLDKGLELWPIYTYELCSAEFIIGAYRKRCGCYPYHSPRKFDLPICNITQLHCDTRHKHPSTVCFYNCNLIYFSQRTIKLDNSTSSNMTNMEIRIIFPPYKYSMKECFSFIDFMTSVGSAAGLFLGCSVLSGMEIFYYTALHFFTFLCKHKHKYN